MPKPKSVKNEIAGKPSALSAKSWAIRNFATKAMRRSVRAEKSGTSRPTSCHLVTSTN
jgi:hypothetical protein